MDHELSPDQKGLASLTLGDVIVQTRDNFPDPRFRPKVYLDTPQYHLYGIDPSPYQVWVTSDGIGTKPELAERLYSHLGSAKFFENLAFDTFAMIESDEARWGRFILGIAQIIDTNIANPDIISALARGAKKVCDEGRFALLNGETAELGYRVSGYGDSRINWNAVGVSLVVPHKLILGEELKPYQPVVALREQGIRSNGLTKARAILEASYLLKEGYSSKATYFLENLTEFLDSMNILPGYKADDLQRVGLIQLISRLQGHNFLEGVLIPWHEEYPAAAEELLRSSTLYSRLMYQAQGGVDGKREIDLVAAAHISGGGVPEKARRMVERKKLGVHIEPVFPEPEGIQMLLDIAKTLPNEGKNLIDDRGACEQWNRGIGFLVVTNTREDANSLVDMAGQLGYEAGVAGRILEDPIIEFRGHSWRY